MIFGWEQRKENNSTIKNTSRSSILSLLTLLSADAKSAVLLKVPSITKVEVGRIPLLHFPRWLCLVHGQLDMSLRRVKKFVKCKYQCFCLFDIQKWLVLSSVLLSPPQKFPLRRDSAKYQLLRLCFQFSPKY